MQQVSSFQKELSRFEEKNAQVLGVSADSVFAHRVWAESLKLTYPLLSDFNNEVSKKYGIFRDESYGGRVRLANERAIFLIDKQGIIRYIDVHDIREAPSLEPILKALEDLEG